MVCDSYVYVTNTSLSIVLFHVQQCTSDYWSFSCLKIHMLTKWLMKLDNNDTSGSFYEEKKDTKVDLSE